MDSVELLDKEIEECLEKARSLRELRNSQYSSTSRLPVDVLVLIFEALAFTKDPKSSEREAYSGSTGLPGDYHPCHNISHVCRSWRTLVLNMSAIWGIFYGDCSKKWMDSMTASRVKPNSPIFLRAPRSPIYKYSYKKQTHVLTFDAAKFGGLEVEVANHEIAAILHHIFRQHITLSVLTSLSLSWPTAGGGGGWRIQWNANAPRLEVMDFYNVPLRVTGGSFPMLQSFTMLFDFAWLYVTVVELLHALKAMPQLRSLKCTRIFADEHDPIPTDLQVQLPYLEHVDIKGLRWQHLCIFDHITSPPLKSFTLIMARWNCEKDLVLNMPQVYKFLPPPSSPTDSWKTLLQKEANTFYTLDQSALRMKIVPGSSSTTPDFRFEFFCCFLHMKEEKDWHVELDICSSLPSMPDILGIVFPAPTSENNYITTSLLPENFVVDMAPTEEVHFDDVTLLLKALMPGHPLGTDPSTERAFSRALPKPAGQAPEHPAPQVYLPNLRQAVLVQRPVEIAEQKRDLALLRLGQIFRARSSIGLPIVTLKIGGDIELSADEKTVLGDGDTCVLQFLSEGAFATIFNGSFD